MRPVVLLALLTAFSSGACPRAAGPKAHAPKGRDGDVAATQPGLRLSLFSPLVGQGYAMVQDRRTAKIAKGRSTLRTDDVPETTHEASAQLRSLTDPAGTTVLSRRFLHQVDGSAAIFPSLVGSEVTAVSESGTVTGTLAFYDGETLTINLGNGKLRLIPVHTLESVAFVPREGTVGKPEFVWEIEAERGGDQLIELTYQALSFSWHSDHEVVLSSDGQTASVATWIAVHNASGHDYHDAYVEVVDEHQDGSATTVDVYPLSGKVDLPTHVTRQVPLAATVSGVPVRVAYRYEPFSERILVSPGVKLDGYWPGTLPQTVQKELVLSNDAASHLGWPLPAGTVHVYREADEDGADLVSEANVAATAVGREMRIPVGVTTELLATRKQVDFRRIDEKRALSEEIFIGLRNTGSSVAEVEVIEHMFRAPKWRIVSESLTHEARGARTVVFRATIPPGGKKDFQFKVVYAY